MGKTVLLTRPEGQNEQLADRLRASSVDTVIKPMIAIEPLPPDRRRKQIIMDLDRYDHIVFVSQNAVRYALDDLEQYWPQWPSALHWHAVGEATGARLRERDIVPAVPGIASTEGLLASSAFDDVKGRKILIVRGTGGRETLASELVARGGDVAYLEVYARRQAVLSRSERQVLVDLLPAVAVVYSGETLEALAANLGEARDGLSIVVPSGRVRTVAAAAGFTDILVASGPDEDSMFEASLRAAR
jgi:uroporphyrinogen-III synthase